MKAVAYTQAALPISDPSSLVDLQLPKPTPNPRDLLVKVHAISVNPVDTKVRQNAQTNEPRILGWDAVGTVEAIGKDVTLFKPGDVVFYAGTINRPGSNAEYQLVDERIVALKPESLKDAHAAALPLTAITAWELLFDRLRIPEGKGKDQVLLITGAAGGVGSMLVQLARTLTQLTVIGTASRSETQNWVKKLGAHHVIDHSQPLGPQLKAAGVEHVRHVASLTHTGSYYTQFIELLAPQGQLALIDDLPSLDAMPLKSKSISLHWESMFTRSVYQTPDMQAQHTILTRVAKLIDEGTLLTTFGEHYGTINATNLRRAHALIESGKAKGKLVLEGFE